MNSIHAMKHLLQNSDHTDRISAISSSISAEKTTVEKSSVAEVGLNKFKTQGNGKAGLILEGGIEVELVIIGCYAHAKSYGEVVVVDEGVVCVGESGRWAMCVYVCMHAFLWRGDGGG
jgi:hypothetical protein